MKRYASMLHGATIFSHPSCACEVFKKVITNRTNWLRLDAAPQEINVWG